CVAAGGVDDQAAESGHPIDGVDRHHVTSASERAAAERQRHRRRVARHRVAEGVLDGDGHGGGGGGGGGRGPGLRGGGPPGGGGTGVNGKRAIAGVEVGIRICRPQDVAAGRIDHQVTEGGDAIDRLHGDRGLAVGEGSVAERRGHRGGVANENVGIDVLDGG